MSIASVCKKENISEKKALCCDVFFYVFKLKNKMKKIDV